MRQQNKGVNWTWILLGFLIAIMLKPLLVDKSGAETVTLGDYNEFLRMLGQNKFVSVEVVPNSDGTLAITATEKIKKEKTETEKKYVITALADPKLIERLESKPEVKFMTQHRSTWLPTLLSWILPVFLILFLWRWMLGSQMGGGTGSGQGGIFNLGKSKARRFLDGENKITFADVAGVDEAKEELLEIVDFLKDPKKFTKLGGRMPKGCLLVGPPGTGKTLLSKAVAGEAGVPFFSISGSDFVEMFVGVGASRVRDLFLQAQKSAPSIIFIDELDALGKKRGMNIVSSHDEREQTLNQLLVEMDGFAVNEGVILLSATNRPDVLDPALLRPGRFDRQIIVNRPDIKGREAILKVHAKNVPLAEDVNLSVIARGTPGFVGADLANLINEAAVWAAKNGKEKVAMSHIEMAKDKVMMGTERKSAIISEKEKTIVAYHESGHTLVAKSLPDADPVHKVTIIPRGLSLGLTGSLPEEDRYMYSRSHLKAQLAVLMGGRASEELFCGDFTTGAGNDIEKATELARKMVLEWGMSELGPQKFGGSSEHPLLGQLDADASKNYSEKTAEAIDEEIKKLLMEAHEKAKIILSAKPDLAHRLAKELLEHETLDAAQIDALIEKVNKKPV